MGIGGTMTTDPNDGWMPLYRQRQAALQRHKQKTEVAAVNDGKTANLMKVDLARLTPETCLHIGVSLGVGIASGAALRGDEDGDAQLEALHAMYDCGDPAEYVVALAQATHTMFAFAAALKDARDAAAGEQATEVDA
jgi:hypothetical protein